MRHPVEGKNIVIIGCGGIFSPADALTMFSAGADLVSRSRIEELPPAGTVTR